MGEGMGAPAAWQACDESKTALRLAAGFRMTVRFARTPGPGPGPPAT